MAEKASPEYDSDEEIFPQSTQEVEGEEAVAEVEEDTSVNNPDAIAKYQESATICQQVIQSVADSCIVGASVHDICKGGDDLIGTLTKNLYKNKVKGRVIEKGVAFPVCISVNDCVAHMSPLTSEEPQLLVAGDLVKIDMGVHIDGYITVSAHTVLVGDAPTAENPITGPLADCIHAAYKCAEVSARMIAPGADNHAVTEAMKKICEAYGVKPLSGSVMHQMKRYVIDGNKNIAMGITAAGEGKVEKCTFEQGEVYALDICLSTGEGKRKEKNTRTTVYKRVVNSKYGLKIAASRKFLNEVQKNFPAMPFSLRSMEDEMLAKMGVRECAGHDLVTPYNVIWSEADSQMFHLKYTVLLCPSGNVKITGLKMPENVVSDKEVPEFDELLSSVSIEKKKKNRGNKKKK